VTNHQSVATVTAMLSQLVQGYAAAAIEGATVTMQRPDAVSVGGTDAITNRVNLFLFQVAFDPARRNDDLATRDSAGRVLQRPKVSLELHYLLSFYGDESTLAPQRMMAAVVAGLHARPLLTMERAAAFVQANQTAGEPFDYLADSRLAEQGSDVRLVPAALNLEELSKLWSVFFQVPYALSCAYKAAVVVVEADEAARSVLPVREPVVAVTGDHAPIAIAAVRPQDGTPTSPVFANTVLAVTGSGFTGSALVAQVDGASVSLAPDSAIAASVDLSAYTLQPGPHLLAIARTRGASSAPWGLIVRPRIASVSAATVTLDGASVAGIRVTTPDTVGSSQRVQLLLERLSPTRASARLDAIERSAAGSVVEALRGNLAAGTWLVRLSVDGAESVLETSGTPLTYSGPTLVLT
jgi:hypothetical protein